MNCFVTAESNQSTHWRFLEGEIIKHLLKKYKNSENNIVIKNDLFCYTEVPDLDVDLEFLRVAFRDFKEITVGKMGLHVSY